MALTVELEYGQMTGDKHPIGAMWRLDSKTEIKSTRQNQNDLPIIQTINYVRSCSYVKVKWLLVEFEHYRHRIDIKFIPSIIILIENKELKMTRNDQTLTRSPV